MPSESYEALSRDGKILADLLGTNLPSGAVSDWKGAIVQAVFSHFGPVRISDVWRMLTGRPNDSFPYIVRLRQPKRSDGLHPCSWW